LLSTTGCIYNTVYKKVVLVIRQKSVKLYSGFGCLLEIFRDAGENLATLGLTPILPDSVRLPAQVSSTHTD